MGQNPKKKRVNIRELECSWSPPPPKLRLAAGDVHVWRIRLDLPQRQVGWLSKFLSPDEQLKANRFRFERHSRRYAVVHGILRVILGKYLSVKPEQLKFSRDRRGKPALVPATADGELCFNLSHSHELALYAVTRDFAIGIDVERIRTTVDTQELAQRFFSPREYAAIGSLPPDQREKAFVKVWTIKEAYLKATGEGLGGLKRVEVGLTPGQPTTLFNTQWHHQHTIHDWSVYLLTPAQGYLGCIVVDGYGLRSNCFRSLEAGALV